MSNVVIVGAGPVGLLLARELRIAGVSTVVLERRTRRSPHSKALTLHPRTAEILAMRALAAPLLESAPRIPSGHFGVLEQRLDFTELDTDFPFTLVVPQRDTEQLLEDAALRAGVEIRFGHRVRTLRQTDDAVVLEVQDGASTYALTADYVVGCDGAQSIVRAAAGIDFPGSESTTFGYLGDVVLDDPPPGGVLSHHSGSGVVMIVPLPGGLFRFVGVDPARQNPGAALDLGELRDTVTRIAGTDFGMRDPVWLSRFGNSARLAARYRTGRVLVAGDAAHIHFPAGGVGLNVGLQDAFNLGWKLAAVVRRRAPASLLDTYHAERHPVGADLLVSSQAQTAIITAFSAEGQALRCLLNELLGDVGDLGSTLAARLSGLSVRYPAGDGADRLVGTRTPNLDVTTDTGPARLFDLFGTGRFVLLERDGTRTHDRDDSVVTAHIDDAASARLGGGGNSLRSILIRPDGHVMWVLRDSPGSPATDHGVPEVDTLLTDYASAGY